MNTKYLKQDQAMSKEIANEFGEGWLPPKPAIEIEKPDAFPGDEVVFNNPRLKWETQSIGKVIHLETHWRDEGEYQHRYLVRPEGKSYTVYVRDVELIVQQR